MKRLIFFFLSFTAEQALAEFTYVDADFSNSTLAGAPFTLSPPANYDASSPSGGDGLWSYRLLSSFEGGDYFETDSGRPPIGGNNDYEATPDIVTTIQLPAAGTYRIVAILANNNGLRDVAAKVGSSPGAGDVFNRANSLEADQTLSSLEIDFDASYSNGRANNASAADLGTVTTTSTNEEIEVYVNGLASTTTLDGNGRHDDERTRYDGIGYELVVPTAPIHHDVFIFAGQSNGDGRGEVSELTGPLAGYTGVQPNALIYYSNPRYADFSDPLYQAWVPLEPGFSLAPGDSGPLPTPAFGHEVAATTILTQQYENVAIIKVTEGGTALGRVGQDWYPPLPDAADVGPLYTEMVTVVADALQALTDQGDTYTLHALYWHQGESDTSRESSYPDLLDRFVRSFRADLGKSNLRFVIGALAPERAPSFIEMQWQTSRELRNTDFVSSINLTTTDGTHFDTSSAISMGLRVGASLVQQGRVIGFDEKGFDSGALHQQGGFSADSEIEVMVTIDSGSYSGGLAVGESSNADVYSANLRGVLPLAEARALKGSFFPSEIDSSLLLAGWEEDLNADAGFQSSETDLGIGLGSDGLFRIQVGGSEWVSTGFSYQEDHWYELEATWTELDASGQSQVSLFVTDLTTDSALNGGLAVVSISTNEILAALWEGTGILVSGGLIDNLGVEGPGFGGWVGNRYPTLVGGPAGDEDSDGIANAFEYAFGLNPFVPNGGGNRPTPTVSGAEFRLTIPELPRLEDVLIQVNESADLQNWNPVEGEVSGRVREYLFPTSEAPRRFLMMGVQICE